MKKTLTNDLGLLGMLSLLSYTAAVIFAPLSYPDYNWLSQAVGDLSAVTAPSKALWDQLSALYLPCGIVCCTASCIAVEGKYNQTLRLGIGLFALMHWVAAAGYTMFPLTDAGAIGGFQNTMHLIVSDAAAVQSVLALGLMIRGSYVQRQCRSLGLWAGTALLLMMSGALGAHLLPDAYFGLAERLSTFAAVGFNAVLGIYLYNDYPSRDRQERTG